MTGSKSTTDSSAGAIISADVAAEPGSILAIDAAGHVCSVALWRSGAVVAAENQAMSHGQAAVMLPMIEHVMQQGGLDLRQIERVAVAVGPGGFTGLRIGLATARGLGLAIGCPVIGISSFQAIATTLLGYSGRPMENGDILVALDSRREEPYLAWLAPDLSFRQPPKLMDMAEISTLLAQPAVAAICGDGVELLAGLIPARLRQVAGNNQAMAVAELAADPERRFDLLPEPHYLRPPDISQPKSTG